jgi:hypothetical protein
VLHFSFRESPYFRSLFRSIVHSLDLIFVYLHFSALIMLSSLQLIAALAALAAVPLALTHPSDLRAMTPRQTSLPSSNHCGDYDYVILTGTPWIVYNMLYNADLTVGTQCTYYNHVITAADGTQEVVWSSTANIKYVESTYVHDLLSLEPVCCPSANMAAIAIMCQKDTHSWGLPKISRPLSPISVLFLPLTIGLAPTPLLLKANGNGRLSS